MPLFKKALFLSLILILLSGAGISGAAMILETKYSGIIQQGVTIAGIPLGGLNSAEAAKILENAISTPVSDTLELKDSGEIYLIKLSDIEGRYDYLSTAEQALEYSNEGKGVNQLISILRLRAAPVNMAIKIAYSEEKLANSIKNVQKEWDKLPKDAEVKLSNDKVIIVNEKNGYRVDFEKTLEQVRQALAEGNLHTEASGYILKPGITSKELEGINTLLSEYVTSFDASASDRTHNITLANTALNGCLLKPGEVFSLNRRLGPRLAETGYLKAPAFIGNSLALDIGGGVCQIATTLYNAVLLADLPVLERYSHPSPVSYVSPGRDATIAGDYLDLKFANNMDDPVYISSTVESGTLTVRIFGAKKSNSRVVKITSEKTIIEPNVITYQDNTLEEGDTRIKDPGKIGYEAKVYREVAVGGQVESKALISTDYYKPTDKIIIIGTKPKVNVKEKGAVK
ncbi:MAG: Vancomycin B-type resistance protein VanW [Pelotomaculum sp. PtaU1.Bin035]|nr:MAG: Vancomycin B-type resistance protein VanW [Pelotomaculum sp. PtaU1.Bin035]